MIWTLSLCLCFSIKPAATVPHKHAHTRARSLQALSVSGNWWRHNGGKLTLMKYSWAATYFWLNTKTLKCSSFPQKESTRSNLRIWLDIRPTLLCSVERVGRWGAVNGSFLKYPPPPSHWRRGECHCYGNLICHKRIPFVTAAQPMWAHIQRQKRKNKWGREEWKKYLRANKGLLVFCLNFPPLERTDKSSLARPLRSLSRELGFRAKKQKHRKDREDYAPFKQLGNHSSQKGRGDQCCSVLLHILSKVE